jgi:integrase
MRSVVLPIPDELAGLQRLQMESVHGPFLFRPMPNSSRDFDAIPRRAGIPEIDEIGRKATAHSLRWTHATLVAEAVEHSPLLLKEIMAHRQVSTTERYGHPTAPTVPISFKPLGVGVACRVIDIAVGTPRKPRKINGGDGRT